MFSESAHRSKLVDVGLARGMPATPQTGLLGWATWRNALLLIFATFVIRLIYLIWLCPYQLLGDEAYYWEQARHLDLCYNEKGPLLAWMIWPCCRAFGDTEWAVRFPMLVSFALAAWGVGGVALAVSRDERVA